MIPVIDMHGAMQGDRRAMEQAAREIERACVTNGFFYISGHGVPQAVIERTVAEAKDFFHLP
ncbi:MAG TPA: 2-oxoglutarate and iron-dependent oxygenase domain-containing protein, partial [Acetobacteraceae bacterium]|nr:2-oxoglutarate and iron-dependent oxygenase domain-containing protein [Acetobacteraceae bacterium]